MKRTLILVTSAVVLAGCAGSTGINSRGWHFLTRYQEIPDYRALAVTPSSRSDAYSMGIGQDRDSVQAAIDEAMQICEKGRMQVRASLKCRLQMVGDVDVSAMDDAAMTAVIAQYEKRTIEDHDEAIRLDPGNAMAYYNRGNAYGNKGEYGRAIEDYSKVIQLSPGHAAAYNNRCWAYGLSRRPEEALRDCNESLRLRPGDPAALDSRALAYWLLGEQDKARRDLERVRQIKPERPSWQERFRQFEAMF